MRAGRQHAQLERYVVINEGEHSETGGRILCAWEDCPRFAYDLYKVVVNHGSPGHPHVVRYAFCSERHKEYFKHSHRDNRNLPAGLRNLSLPR